MKIMCSDLISTLQYTVEVAIYEQNAWDQNFLLYKGRIYDMDTDDNANLMEYYTAPVELIVLPAKERMLIKIRTDQYNVPAKDRYFADYVAKWKNNDPNTRPWLHSIETEEYKPW